MVGVSFLTLWGFLSVSISILQEDRLRRAAAERLKSHRLREEAKTDIEKVHRQVFLWNRSAFLLAPLTSIFLAQESLFFRGGPLV